MREWRCGSFLEIGPGRALQKFVGATLSGQPHRVLQLQSELLPTESERPVVNAELNFEANPLLRLLQKAIARVTGYQLERITIEDRFQDDLGIDSLKTAEIILEVAKESGKRLDPAASMVECTDVRSAVEMLRCSLRTEIDPVKDDRSPSAFVRGRTCWKKRPIRNSIASNIRSASLDASGLRDRVEISVEQIVRRSVDAAGCARQLRDRQKPLFILRADAPIVDWPQGAVGEKAALCVENLARCIEWFQEFLREMTIPDLEMFLITSAATPPAVLGLSAFLASVRREYPAVFVKHLQIMEKTDLDNQGWLLNLIDQERIDPFDFVVRYENGCRLVPELLPIPAKRAARVREVVVAFGGARGITFSLLTRILARGSHVYLLGRSPVGEVTVATNLETLRCRGLNVTYRSLDATDFLSVRRFLDDVRRRRHRIDLVINGTGMEVSRPLARKTAQDIRAELRGKILPAIHIQAACAAVRPRRFVQFSSVVARMGNVGQTVYSCANGVIDALVEDFNRSRSDIQAWAIDWPPWDGVGMTARVAIHDSLRARGISLLNEEQAAALFLQDLNEGMEGVCSYYDPDDQAVFQFPLRRIERLRSLLGVPGSGRFFEKRFSLDSDRYLQDHRLDGQMLVPAAVAMCMIYWFALLQNPEVNTLEAFEVVHPMVVGPNGLAVRLSREASGKGLEIASLARHAVAIPCACPTGDTPLVVEQQHGAKVCGRLEEPPEDLYKKRLFHGPTFQLLHRVGTTSAGRRCAEIEWSRLVPLCGVEAIDRSIVAIDAAFQIVAFEAICHGIGKMLPVRVESTTWVRESRWDRLYIDVSRFEILDDLIRADVSACDDQGAQCLRLEGIELRVMKSSV